MAQSVRNLPHRHENLSSIPRTHGKVLGKGSMFAILALEKWGQEDPGALLAAQSTL